MTDSETTIESSPLQSRLQTIYWKVIVYIVIWTTVLSLLFILKSLLIYFLLPIKHLPVLDFLLSPETNSVEDTSLSSLYETILSLLAMLTSFALMMISTKAEKLYIASFKEIEDPQVFLFSLEISGLPNIRSADFVTRMFEGLQGDSISPHENAVAEVVYVFDMDDYFETKREMSNYVNTDPKLNERIRKSRLSLAQNLKGQSEHGTSNYGTATGGPSSFKFKQSSGTNPNSRSRAFSTDLKSRRSKLLTSKFQSMPMNQYNGKMIITFRNLELVYDIINLFHCGLLNVKIRSDLESALQLGILGGKPSKLAEALDDTDKNSLFNKISIKAARDPHDMIWPYYGLRQSTKLRDKRWRLLMCFVISIIVSFLVAVVYYLSIRELLKLKFLDSTGAWTLSIGETKIYMNWKIIVMMVVTLVVPLLGTLIVETLAEFIQMDYFSNYNNTRFRLEILFEVIHRYLFIHYAFTRACQDTRALLDPREYDKLYKYIYVEWNKIAAILIISTIFRYLIKHLKRCFEKIKKRKTPEKINFSIDHSVSSTNLLLTFMYMGFYFPVLSVSIVILLTLNMLINMVMYYFVYKNNKILRDYLSYHNITMLINHCLVAFNVGGVMSLWIHVDFTRAYFRQVNTWSGQLPSNFIGSIFMLLFAFINYMINKPNSLRLRVLQNVLTHPQYSTAPLLFEEALKMCNYRNNNPYYKERKRLRDSASAQGLLHEHSDGSGNESNPLLGIKQRMMSVHDSFSKKRESYVEPRDMKNMFAMKLEDLDRKNK